MPDVAWVLMGLVVFLALAFDFINGFHDTANAIACSVSTGVLTPRLAIIMAAVMNLAGAMWSTKVAATIGKGIIDPSMATTSLVIAALISAIGWNLLTWWWGLPSSSSHALIGGVIGAAVAGHGLGALRLDGIFKILKSLIASPLLGFLLALSLMIALFWAFRSWVPSVVKATFRPLQILAAAFISFTHGANDAQKSMGIILLALIGAQQLHAGDGVPFWVKISCALAMAMGTSVGGWKIIKTMGSRVTRLEPINGFAADLASASIILSATNLGLPVSTTHVAASSIMGVGSARRVSAVRWGKAGEMFVAWIITIPITSAIAALVFLAVRALGA
ncbi:MAG: inorganic phosphate transporter [Candidatus Sericytochromatia bacterium]|nr:inorganic phosphate transporter [Candidatus Sericytochromatia bacterium]